MAEKERVMGCHVQAEKERGTWNSNNPDIRFLSIQGRADESRRSLVLSRLRRPVVLNGFFVLMFGLQRGCRSTRTGGVLE